MYFTGKDRESDEFCTCILADDQVPHILRRAGEGAGTVPGKIDRADEFPGRIVNGDSPDPFSFHGGYFRKNGDAELQGDVLKRCVAFPDFEDDVRNDAVP